MTRKIRYVLIAAAFVQPVYALTLFEAVHEALSNNPQIKIASEELRLSMLEEPALLALTDPTVGVRTSVAEDRGPRSAPAIQGPYTKTENLDFFVNQSWLIGTDAKLFFNTERRDSPAQFRPMNPTVDSQLGLEIRQPLLRYFWGRPDKAKRQQLRAGVRSYEEKFKRAQEMVAAQTAFSYVNAWFSNEMIAVQHKAVQDAERLLKKYTEKRSYGLVEKSDVLQAKASLRVQQTELRASLAARVQADNSLQAQLFREKTEEHPRDFELPLLPDVAFPTLEEAMDQAFQHRSDLKAAWEMKTQAEWTVRVHKLETLPELSAFGSYASAGLGPDRRRSWRGAESFDDEVWLGGLEFQVALSRKREKIKREEARRRLDIAAFNYRSVEEQVRQEVGDALERLKLHADRKKSYEELLAIQEERLKAEEENFNRGRSSTDLLIRFQDDIRQTKSQWLKASADELSGWAELAYVTGTLLETLAQLESQQ